MKRKVMILALIFLLFLPAMGFTQDCEITGVWVKWTRRGMHSYDFEAEIQVRSYEDRERLVSGSLGFYNRDGRSVHSRMFSGRVKAGERVTLVKRGTVSVRKREQIDHWDAALMLR